jgi:UDP-glucose 4-epimerase
VDKIADATKDWFKYLGDHNAAASGTPQKASR